MFVIAGASGNTGKAAAEALLAQKKSVRVIVRDASAAEAWRARGAEAAVADLDDVAALTSALRARLIAGRDAEHRPARPWDLNAFVGAGGLRSTASDMLT